MPNGKQRKLGPNDTFEQAFNPPWWKFWEKSHPERMRRDCAFCKAVYYELPKDVARVNDLLKHADSLLEAAMKK